MEILDKDYNLIKCNQCKSDNYSVLYEFRDKEEKDSELLARFRSSADETLRDRVVQCNRCGLAYINPVLSSPVILDGYKNGTDETFVSQNYARERTFSKCLKIIEKYTPIRGRILDIGTAGGAFLHICRQRGWDVAGVEPNLWLCQWAKGKYKIDISPGTIFDQDYAGASFNVITLWDVLEHTSDPKGVLEECYRILKPGGLIVINIPDIGSWIARLMGRRWVFLLSVHLYYFNKKTISHMLTDTGFNTVCIKPHFQYLELSYILKRAMTYIGNIAGIGHHIVNVLGMNKILIPYWMGQTLVIAKRNNNIESFE